MHNLNYGDRDSLGVFQQRPRCRPGAPPAQILNPDHAAMMFITNAIRLNGVPERRPARPGRAGLRLPRPLRPGRPAGVRAADEVLLMRLARCSCARWSFAGLRRARRRGPGGCRRARTRTVYGPSEAVPARAARDPDPAAPVALRGGRARARGGRDRRRRDDGRDRRAPEGARHRRRRPDRGAEVVDAGAPTARSAKARCARASASRRAPAAARETIPATVDAVAACGSAAAGATSRRAEVRVDRPASQPATYVRAPC